MISTVRSDFAFDVGGSGLHAAPAELASVPNEQARGQDGASRRSQSL